AAAPVDPEVDASFKEPGVHHFALLAKYLAAGGNVARVRRGDRDDALYEIVLVVDELPGRGASHRVTDDHDRARDDLAQQPTVPRDDVAVLQIDQVSISGSTAAGPV